MLRLSVVWKINLLVLAGLTLLLGSSVIFGLVQTGSLGEQNVRVSLTGSGVAASLVLDPELVASVTPETTSGEAYTRSLEQLKRLSGTFGLSDLYVVRPAEGGWEFVYDTADGPFDEEKGLEGGFSPYEDPPEELGEAWKGLDPVVTEEPYTDEYGTFRSAFVALAGADGKPVAVIGADFNLQQLSQAREAQLLLSAGLAVTGLVLLGLLAWLLVRIIDVPLNLVSQRFTELAEGKADFSDRVVVKSRDELGALADGFNTFLGKMKSLVSDLRTGVGEAGRIQLLLQRDSEETATTLVQTRNGLESLKVSSVRLESSLVEVAANLESIAEQGSNLDALAKSQEQTADRVALDHAGLDREASELRTRSYAVGKALAELDTLSTQNSERMDAEISVLRQLSGAVESVNNIVTTLVNTADATNLLAMNASIEAAHAGSQGRGFAVIAQRMRQQGQTSKADADRIGETLGRMVELIGQAAAAAEETARGAETTHARIEDAKTMVEGLTAAGDNLDAFAKRNREAVEALRRSSRGVAVASSAVASGTVSISGATRSLREVSDAVVKETGTILEGSHHVASVVEDIREVANRLTTVSRSLEQNLLRIRAE